MKKSLRHTLLIGLASFISIVVILASIVAVSRLTLLSESPADFLPAERTVALLHHVSDEQKTTLSTWFPELTFIQQPDAEAIAIVALPGGGRGSVTFRLAAPGAHGTHIRGPYALEFSDPFQLPSAQDDTPLLSNDQAYKAFASQTERTTSWTYLKREVLPAPTDLSSRIADALLFHSASAIALHSNSGSTLRIDRYVPDQKRSTKLSQKPLLFPGVFLAVAHSHLEPVIADVLKTLPAEEQVIMESLLRSLMETYAGKSMSWEFDRALLLGSDTSLFVRQGNTELQYVLLGSAPEHKSLLETLERLHVSFRSTLPTSRVEERKFDDRFPSRIIESSEEQILEEERTIGPWTMHVMRHATEQTIFLTAVSGNRFALSNDAAFLETVLQQKGQPLPGTAEGTLIGAGMVDKAVFMQRLQPMLPPSATILLPYTYTGTVLWTLSQHGQVESLHITPGNSY